MLRAYEQQIVTAAKMLTIYLVNGLTSVPLNAVADCLFQILLNENSVICDIKRSQKGDIIPRYFIILGNYTR